MRHKLAIVLAGLIICIGARAQDAADPLAAKKAAWQKKLESEKFNFTGSKAGLEYSKSEYRGDRKITVTNGPIWAWSCGLKLERDGKIILDCADASAFRVVDNVLYLANAGSRTCGCKVVAYDLTTGKMIWETGLRAAEGPEFHSAYANQVTMDLSHLKELDKEGDGAIVVTGHESYGDYVDILDRRTGKFLAHKLYRQGFGEPKKQP